MTAQDVHQVDVAAAFLTLFGWAGTMFALEKVVDQRVRWVRVAFFAPLTQACEHLPDAWSPLHGVLGAATVFWLGAVLMNRRELRAWLFAATTACLVFLAITWAVST